MGQRTESPTSSEDLFEVAVESSPCGMILVGADGRMVMVNGEAEAIFGYPRGELIGAEVELLVPEHVREKHRELRSRLFGEAGIRPMGAGREFVGRRNDGTEVAVEIALTPVRRAGALFILASVVDISERRRAEEERRALELRMERTQRLESLGVLAGGIAHEFNNLLAVVLGKTDLALRQLESSSAAREHVTEIEWAARRASELTKQMLAYVGGGRFAAEAVDLSWLVRGMIHMFEAAIPDGVELKMELESDLPGVELDALQIRQIALNLITNASEAIGAREGAISVRTGAIDCDRVYLEGGVVSQELPEGVYVFLEVSDDGDGMSQKVIDRIFDPFYTTKFPGRGLGLAAVLGIVRNHHGTLRVDSKPGRGTRFTILFPARGQARA